jgi:phenylalanyl-tRNA synthetase alpha chain
MLEKVNKLLKEVEAFLPKSEEETEGFRLKFLGKKGEMNTLFAAFKEVPNESKKRIWTSNKHLKTKCSS